ncbi:MAG: Eco57I restriction-modification methylase domain-containing protein [Syntrophobacterales bacterium]|nr:Eco57I restriction-modification methylase domain-containing protein [Syntrophobacterales bacterium]
MIRQYVKPVAKLDYNTLCESLIRTFGMTETVKWDSSLSTAQQQQLFGGELLRIVADHPTLAQQHDIRALCWPKGTVSQLLFLFVRLSDDRLPKAQIERITRRFVGGLEAERYTVWFFGNPSQTMLKVVLAGREGKKTVCKTLTLEAGQWYKTYDFILDTVAKQNAMPAQRDMFAVGEPSLLWKALWQAFDISIVNKNFYLDIKVAFDSLITALSKCKGILTRPEQRAQFAVRLLGRLIFCWFLKKKGIVGSDALSSATVTTCANFYHELLEPLFFDVFNTPQNARKAGLPACIAGLRFLNGGLFEPQTDDCRGNFQLLIPNDWFAGFFGDTLERYNFTVDENSSANSEIAIDPEMLGRIFENLLAEQNPQTGASARKQTGSFYTPRPIVDYMVEESLIAYLGSGCADFVHTGELPTDLKSQPSDLLNKLNSLRTIDVAAGSGAFPMGMLQKIVMLKQALNPKASLYDLKLKTIENSIYGVDIQPMAIELSRLRCWLSLIVDEEPDKVQPLPNLDFKFVCADSLIDLGYQTLQEQCEKRYGFLFLQEFDDKINELKRIRHGYFDTTHNHNRKQQLKQEFLKVQDEIFRISLDLVKQKLISPEFANRITGWNPFDDSKAAPFFSPAWMFGVEDGFDISIGNPPYVRADAGEEHLAQRKRIIESKQYVTLWEKWDLFIPFIELGYKILKPNGVTTMIVSDAYCHSKYAQKSQEWFLRNSRVMRLDFLSKIKVFDAGVHNIVYFFQKTDGTTNKPERCVHEIEFGKIKKLPTDEQQNLSIRAFFPDDIEQENYTVKTVTLNKICYISYGLRPNSDENDAKGEFVTADVVSLQKDCIHCKAYVEGKHLARWLPVLNVWIEWGTNRAPAKFCRPTFPELHETPEKLLAQKNSGPDPLAVYPYNDT